MTVMRSIKQWGFIILILAAMFTLSAPLRVVAADSSEEWPQFMNQPDHPGYSTATAPDTATLKWVSEDIGAVSSSSVSIADGRLFVVANSTGNVTCLNIDDGSEIWRTEIVPSSVWGSWTTPSYDNGCVYVATDGIYCLDADGGHQLWKYTFPKGLSACNGAVTVVDGRAIAGDWDGSTYYCVNATDGSFLWQYDCGGGYAQGTPAYHEGKFFLTCWGYVGGNVYCVNADDGSLVWHSDGREDGTYYWDSCGSVSIAEGKVFFTTYNFGGYGELMALNEADGTVAWGPQQVERTDSTPAYHDGYIYLCGGCEGYSYKSAYCFVASNGSPVWSHAGIGGWTCSVAVADGKVFVGTEFPGKGFDYNLTTALSAENGTELWHYDHGGSSPVVAGRALYTIGEGRVWAFEDEYTESPYAAEVIDYSGYFGGPQYDDPEALIGPPATNCVNSGYPSSDPFRIKLVEPAYNLDLEGKKVITTIPNGSYITVKFDHKVMNDPENPYGIDFLVFGNAFFTGTGDFVSDGTNLDAYMISDPAKCFSEPGIVSVSQDGTTWYEFTTGPYADSMFPTQAYHWDSETHSWGDRLMDFTKPVDPALTLSDFDGVSAGTAIQMYNGSGGGTGFDLDDVGLEWIRYIKVSGGTEGSAEVDAFADVSPPPPSWDINGDREVNVLDLILIGNHFGETGESGWIREDVNMDGRINVLDMIIAGNHFGETS